MELIQHDRTRCQTLARIAMLSCIAIVFAFVNIERCACSDEKDKEIEAGVGWDSFRVGATRQELIESLGEPDDNSTERHLIWRKQLKIHCLVDDRRGAFELRFDPGFEGRLKSGIQIGSDTARVTESLGEPEQIVEKGTAEKWIFLKKGVLFWTKDDKVTQIVVFRPRA